MPNPTACPKCESARVRVVLTRHTRDYLHILRRRHCQSCDHRWYTLQDAERPIASYAFTWLATSNSSGGQDFVLFRPSLVS